MKVILHVFVISLSFLLGAASAFATPLDLTTFTQQSGVSISDGTVTFSEQELFHAIYFYNDNFLVGPLAGFLSFNYSLTLGPNNNDDFLVGVINFTDYFFEVGVTQAGSFQFDFSPFRNQMISLAFGLESNDQLAGSIATISRLDLGVAAVPEPGTFLLLGSGLAGLLGIGRKKISWFLE